MWSRLTEFAWAVRSALCKGGITGAEGKEIDHIELSSCSRTPGVDSRNFVLCPGKAYDRSPCGTGTSAKLACLAADGKLAPGQVWRQAGILGTVFEGSYQLCEGKLIPSITGTAFITAESRLILSPGDPFPSGHTGMSEASGMWSSWGRHCGLGLRTGVRKPRAAHSSRRRQRHRQRSHGSGDGTHRSHGRLAGANGSHPLFADAVAGSLRPSSGQRGIRAVRNAVGGK